MAQVFISYSRKDFSFVEQLAADLEKAGVDVWYDKTDIGGGARWRVEIQNAIKNCQSVIVVLSPDSMASEWVDREFIYASNLDRKIIPLYCRECELTINYVDRNYIDVRGDKYQENFDQILLALNAAPVSSSEEKPKRNLPGWPASWNRNTNLAVWGSIFIVIIFIVAGLRLWLFPPATPTPLPETTVPVTVAIASSTSTATETATSTATVTSTPETPTLTPATATHTVTSTATTVPPVPLGEDWTQGCISTLWKPYPADVPVTDKGNGCWREPVHVFTAENGDLDFLAEQRRSPVEVYGLFAALPETGTVTVKVQLKDLNNVDLWMGVFAEQDVNSDGLLMIIPAGNIKKRVFVQKDPSTYETITSSDLKDQDGGYSITLNFNENSARGTVNPSFFFTRPVPIPSSQKWLFLGYKGLSGSYRVDGRFFSFEIK